MPPMANGFSPLAFNNSSPLQTVYQGRIYQLKLFCDKDYPEKPLSTETGVIPTNPAGLIEYRAHPFWIQKYCLSYEHGTPCCCSCERIEVSLNEVFSSDQILFIGLPRERMNLYVKSEKNVMKIFSFHLHYIYTLSLQSIHQLPITHKFTCYIPYLICLVYVVD